MARKKRPVGRKKQSKFLKIKQKLILLKNKIIKKLDPIKSKLKEALKKVFKLAGVSLLILASAVFFIFVSAKAPEYHEDFLTAKMGKNVVVLTGLQNHTSGGTGFQMKTPQGLRVISNAHICQLGIKNGYMLAHADYTMQILKILKIDPIADLCMLEGVNGLPGLKLGSQPEMGDTIGILGHPLLQPQTFSKGRILAKQLINIIIGYYSPKTCNGPGEFQMAPFFCVKTFISYYTNAMIFPGNSGSPAVNFFGNVVGVVFAGNNRTNYGHLVTYEDLKRFINE
jgi:S1-C subfamily serine protease